MRAVTVKGRILKLLLTGAAGRYTLLPACDTVMGQDPTTPTVTVLPDTVQLPEAENATGNPEVAVALIVKGESPNVRFGSGAKVIDWFSSDATLFNTRLSTATPHE